MDKVSEEILAPIKKGLDSVKSMFSEDDDIISVIKEDHKPLKELIKIMKDPDQLLSARVNASAEFVPLLLTHAKAEEQSLYDFMKTNPALKQYAFEGDIEHGLADQLSEQGKRLTNESELGANIKVLAELVEHHIEEEESDILPAVKSALDSKVLHMLTEKYTAIQAQLIADGQDDSPHERDLTETSAH